MHPLPKDTAEGPTALDDLRYLAAVSRIVNRKRIRKRERSTYMYVCFTKSYDLRVTLKVDRKSTSLALVLIQIVHVNSQGNNKIY